MRKLAKRILNFYATDTAKRLAFSFIIFYSLIAVMAENYNSDEIDRIFNGLITFGLSILLIYGLIKILGMIVSSSMEPPKRATSFRKNRTLEEIDQMTGVQRFLIELFRLKGFRANGTPSTGDFGADLIVENMNEKIAVQAKCYSGKVGVSAVQEAISGKAFYKCNRAMVITNSRFTSKAIELAKSARVELWDRDRLSSEIRGFEFKTEEQHEMI